MPVVEIGETHVVVRGHLRKSVPLDVLENTAAVERLVEEAFVQQEMFGAHPGLVEALTWFRKPGRLAEGEQ